jgi:hypothetical protein
MEILFLQKCEEGLFHDLLCQVHVGKPCVKGARDYMSKLKMKK